MVSFKQLEAIYWVSLLGTFAAAAEKLHTSESAISKRITELESTFNVELFDRTLRSARLTRRGAEVVEFSRSILDQRGQLLERMGKTELTVRRFRVGVTELIALTWLPRLVEVFRAAYPDISFEPEIDLSTVLCEKLNAGSIDLAIVPPVFSESGVVAVPLQELELSWMCKPGLVAAHESLSIAQIAKHPILTQTGKSGVDTVYDQWFLQQRVPVRKIFAGNSLLALAALTAAGFGISYLPRLYFRDLVECGTLQQIEAVELNPSIRYYAVYRGADEISGFSESFAKLCEEVCNFAKSPAAPSMYSAQVPPPQRRTAKRAPKSVKIIHPSE
jgi:DNA-binding transcriptional LysR family regulator